MKMVAKMDRIRQCRVSPWLGWRPVDDVHWPDLGRFYGGLAEVSPLCTGQTLPSRGVTDQLLCTRDSREAEHQEPVEEAMRCMDMGKKTQMWEREGNASVQHVEEHEFEEMILRCQRTWVASTGSR
uniref:Uncharacterized protein n=1 Tax=Arundo donax TaxID=35708 RepID=A0A0A9VTN4_ARUDO